MVRGLSIPSGVWRLSLGNLKMAGGRSAAVSLTRTQPRASGTSSTADRKDTRDLGERARRDTHLIREDTCSSCQRSPWVLVLGPCRVMPRDPRCSLGTAECGLRTAGCEGEGEEERCWRGTGESNEPPNEKVDSVRVEQFLHCRCSRAGNAAVRRCCHGGRAGGARR